MAAAVRNDCFIAVVAFRPRCALSLGILTPIIGSVGRSIYNIVYPPERPVSPPQHIYKHSVFFTIKLNLRVFMGSVNLYGDGFSSGLRRL